MTEQERYELQSAIATICDPRGNWHYGWGVICRMADMDPGRYPAPFKRRTEEDLRALANAPFLEIPPRKPLDNED